MAVVKTVGIKLALTDEQEKEIKRLFEAFRVGINWSLKEIEKRYQMFLSNYTLLPKEQQEEGICARCGTTRVLSFVNNSQKVCGICATKTYSQYTIRKEIYGTEKREVDNDLKDVVVIPAKTHYDSLFSMSYALWSSFNGWRKKKIREKELLEAELSKSNQTYLKAAMEIERKAVDRKRENPKLIWRTAVALSKKEVFGDYTEDEQDEISRLHDRLRKLNRLRRGVHFPELEKCVTVMMDKSFVKWDDGKLYMTLFDKGKKEIQFLGKDRYFFNWAEIPGRDRTKLVGFITKKLGILWVKTANIEKIDDDNTIRLSAGENFLTLKLIGNAVKLETDDGTTDEFIAKHEDGKLNIYRKGYLSQFLPKMQADTVRCNLTKKNGEYYLMYPLEIKVKQPPDIKECDTFVFISSPTKTAIVSYARDGTFNSVKWFPTGMLAFAKRHFKEKRAEIAMRRSGDEKMRKIRRRKKKIKWMGGIEQRVVSTSNHQLTRKMVDYVMSQSENPKILIWDAGNGITQNFGKMLNYLKNLWPVVQQQEYLRHKAMQMSIPVPEIKYNICNDLTCSSCGEKQKDGKKAIKVITQLIKNVKNFKCRECGYETSMLINQANVIKDCHIGDLYK